jgi:hypothetical protein
MFSNFPSPPPLKVWATEHQHGPVLEQRLDVALHAALRDRQQDPALTGTTYRMHIQ